MEFKVQEVFIKEIRSNISKTLPICAWPLPPPGCARPALEGQWVPCRVVVFFSSWPFPPRRQDWVADRQQAGGRESCSSMHAAYLFPHPRLDPSPPSSTPRGAWAPARVRRGPLPPMVRAASSGTTSFIVFAFGVGFPFPSCLRWESFR